MNYKVNNISQPKMLVTFNNIPTIITLENAGTTSTKAKLELLISGNQSLNEKHITINDVTLYSTTNIDEAKANFFWISRSTSYSESRTKAYYFVQACLNTTLANDYNIYIDHSFISATAVKVILEAKNEGSEYNITTLDSNIETDLWAFRITNGTSSDDIANSKVTLDIYADDSLTQKTIQTGQALAAAPTKHICQLEKYYQSKEISFDISPVLRAITNDGNTTQYRVIISALKGTTYRKLYDVYGLHCINGYQVNQGKNYIQCNTTTKNYLLQNITRGEDKPYANNTVLYYLPDHKMTLSVLTINREAFNATIQYLDSSKASLQSETIKYTPEGNITTLEYTPTNVANAHYITIEIPNIGKVIYNNILPVNYSDNKDNQTIYWFNSYGGTSFFTFTGNRTEERESEKQTFNHSSLYYYTHPNEQEKVLKSINSYEATLQSHLVQNDGKYHLNDLLNAYTVWTYINGVKYNIIIDSYQLNEVQRDIYQLTITYHYSSKLV